MTYFLAILVILALFAFISWRDLRHGLILIAAALPAYLLRFEILGVPMTLLEMMILILFVLSLRGGTTKQSPGGLLRFARNDRFTVPILLLLTAATISIFVAPDKLAALGIWKAYFVEPILLFLVATNVLKKNPSARDGLLTALCAGGLFVALFAIVQKLTGLGIPVPWDVEGRVTSIFPYPNAMGLYLGPIIVICVMSFRGTKRLSKSVFFCLMAIASSIGIVFSQSEAAIVAVLATLFLAMFAIRKLRLPAVLLAVVAIIAILALPTLRDKLTLQDYSGQVRLSQWRETIAMLKDHPVFGAGLSGYPSAMVPYHADTQYEIFQYPHNLVLNIWTELGLLGLIAFALLAYRIIKSVNLSALEAFAVLSAIITMAIHGLVDVPYFKNDLAAMTWLLLAVIASAYVLPAKNRDA
jgi:O-antigen ligase